MDREARLRHLFIRRLGTALCAAALLSACGSTPKKETAPSSPPPSSSAAAPSPAPSAKYYKDDGPGESPPPNLDAIPDATPRLEPLNRFANRPYTVLGQDYVPATALRPYKERGIASWYGRKFHSQKTSIGETYDMYGMTAAHPTLPLPSYARVTNVATGRSVIVRVNDRGPFLHGRIIDLSYAAAYRIGVAQAGSGLVEVEAIIPGDSIVAVATPPLPPVESEVVTTAPLIVTPSPIGSVSASAAIAGFAVQLGAFTNFANAQEFLAHVQNQLTTAQVEAKVRQAGGLYRVYVGPYADRDEARRVGERINQAFGFATTIRGSEP
jgi:rare lipoprotein A